MRKKINKKGFSLVELMIVVVIMGILMAVAIPLYGAITENARAKTCGSNQKAVIASFSKWVLNESGRDADDLFKTSEKSFNSKTQNPEDVLEESYLEQFEGGFPVCTSEGHYYVIEKKDSVTIEINCYDADGNLAEKHNR